MELMVIPFF